MIVTEVPVLKLKSVLGYERVEKISRDSNEERRTVDMTDFELLSLVIAILTLIVASTALLLKLLTYLDNRYKK